jgi:hypothetical protein
MVAVLLLRILWQVWIYDEVLEVAELGFLPVLL